jgi:indole-3-glycerol phosphate synthase
MTDILDRIAAYKRAEVADRKAKRSISQIETATIAAGTPRGFKVALERAYAPGRLALIAEIKKASPSKGLIRADFDPPVHAAAYASGGAACLSVLTDGPSFQGDDAYLVAARATVDLPVLRKDFMIDPWQIAESRALGADCILVILALCDDALATDLLNETQRLGMDALVEVHDEDEMERAGALGATLVGVNNRNLRTFATDLGTTGRLAALAPQNALLVTESGIHSVRDITTLEQSGARAMLVGESLMRQVDVTAATRALLGI